MDKSRSGRLGKPGSRKSKSRTECTLTHFLNPMDSPRRNGFEGDQPREIDEVLNESVNFPR